MQKGEYVYIILNKIDERDFGGIYSVQSITEKIYAMKQIFFRDDRVLFFSYECDRKKIYTTPP